MHSPEYTSASMPHMHGVPKLRKVVPRSSGAPIFDIISINIPLKQPPADDDDVEMMK